MERKENGSLKLKEFLKVFFATESFSRMAKFAKSGNRTEQDLLISTAEEKMKRNEEIAEINPEKSRIINSIF